MMFGTVRSNILWYGGIITIRTRISKWVRFTLVEFLLIINALQFAVSSQKVNYYHTILGISRIHEGVLSVAGIFSIISECSKCVQLILFCKIH